MDDKLRQICFFMFLKGFIVSWVDLLTLALVIAGVCRGRKRGMSEELLDLIKWLLTVVIAGRLYQPLGRVLAESTVFSLLACYVAVYCGLILLIKLLFAVIQRTAGQKLVGSDVFGTAENCLAFRKAKATKKMQAKRMAPATIPREYSPLTKSSLPTSFCPAVLWMTANSSVIPMMSPQ